jgi:hypothetical protein
MMRARKESLRQLTEDEHQVVERVAHSGSERADRVLVFSNSGMSLKGWQAE